MNSRRIGLIGSVLTVLCIDAFSAPVGAVLYRQNSSVHISHINVPKTAYKNYFGYLAGPALENRYCAYRTYVDSLNRNAVDFITKFQQVPVLHYFDDSTVDEHATWPWGTDCFAGGTSMGLGAFRLFYNNQWLNPQLGHNLDSLVITILDSSTQTPRLSIGYWGWNIGTGSKLNVLWTISTSLSERCAHCEVVIDGTYAGKIVVGIENNNTAPTPHPVSIIKDSTKALLETIGVQGGLSEGFTDTLLLAVLAPPSYFFSWSQDTYNVGMVLTPDAGHKVTWQIGYSEAREINPVYRMPGWRDSLFGATATVSTNRFRQFNAASPFVASPKRTAECFTISGKKVAATVANTGKIKAFQGIVIMRYPDGTVRRKIADGK